jgi:glycosyltransferase involved in cell wall biosynthesis
LEQLSYSYAAGIIAHSPLNAENLHELTHRKPYFTRAPWLAPVATTSADNAETGLNLVISGLQLAKGAETMIAAARLVAGTHKSWQCHWIGGDTHTAPGGKPVSDYLAEKYSDVWNKNFIWIPEKTHEEVINEIARASVCIIPSVWETFNYFALEAAYAKKPLILTEDTGAVYLFEGDPNVKIIPSDEPEALAVVLAGMLADESGLGKWKKEINGDTKQRLSEYFNAALIVEERLDVYRQIIANRKSIGNQATEALRFLDKYTTNSRKWYYSLRKKIKSIVKGS